MEIEPIDLIKIFRIIKHRLWVIILILIICLTVSFAYTFYFVAKQYQANVLLYIWQDNKVAGTSSENNSNYNDMMLFTQLVKDYQVLCKSRLVTGTVAQNLGMSKGQSDVLSGQIVVATKDNTRHLTITVTDPDPSRAADIANEVSAVFSKVVVENMGAGTVKIIDPAIVPTEPSSPNVRLNLTFGLLIGLLLGFGLVTLIEVLDTRVKTTQDIETITGFTPLGGIPEFNLQRSANEGRR